MEWIVLVVTLVGGPLVGLGTFVLVLIAIKLGVRKLTRRWAMKRLALYRRKGLIVNVSMERIDTFAGSIAMMCYGLLIIAGAGGLLWLGYRIIESGLNPDLTVLWSISGFIAIFGTAYAALFGHFAYTQWKASFLPLANEYARITEGTEKPFTMH